MKMQCIDDKGQNGLKLGEVYEVETTLLGATLKVHLTADDCWHYYRADRFKHIKHDISAGRYVLRIVYISGATTSFDYYDPDFAVKQWQIAIEAGDAYHISLEYYPL